MTAADREERVRVLHSPSRRSDSPDVVAEHRAFWVILSLAALGGALFACFITLVWSDLFGVHRWFIALALIGVPPTFVALAESIDGRGHPGRWLAASAAVYLVWYVAAYT